MGPGKCAQLCQLLPPSVLSGSPSWHWCATVTCHLPCPQLSGLWAAAAKRAFGLTPRLPASCGHSEDERPPRPPPPGAAGPGRQAWGWPGGSPGLREALCARVCRCGGGRASAGLGLGPHVTQALQALRQGLCGHKLGAAEGEQPSWDGRRTRGPSGRGGRTGPQWPRRASGRSRGALPSRSTDRPPCSLDLLPMLILL